MCVDEAGPSPLWANWSGQLARPLGARVSGRRAAAPALSRTPDGRYFVVRGRLWRCVNPHLPAHQRELWVRALMTARRGLRRDQTDPAARRAARAQVQAAKVALGERGPPWWDDGSPTYDRCLAVNTPYRHWYLQQPGARVKETVDID